MEHRIKLYHRAARIKSSIETKISQFYFPTSVYSCRELRDTFQFWIQIFVALVANKKIISHSPDSDSNKCSDEWGRFNNLLNFSLFFCEYFPIEELVPI